MYNVVAFSENLNFKHVLEFIYHTNHSWFGNCYMYKVFVSIKIGLWEDYLTQVA
jgi:hypothetical protein